MFYSYFDGLCKKKGVSPNKACQEMGVSRSVAAKWKNTNTFPRYDTLLKISDYFGVPIDTLLKQTESIKKMPDTQTSAGHREEEYEEPENILRDYVMRAYSLHPENFVKLKEYLELLVLSQKDEGNK